MNSHELITAFFVYGTLKSGHLRGGLWPCKPLAIEPAVARAALFDLGPYPAITPGNDWVLGELWKFSPSDMSKTKTVLDQIEGYQELGQGNEYDRRVVDAQYQTLSGYHTEKAFAYFAADPKVLEIARPIPPFATALNRPVAYWPDSLSKVPASFSEEQ
jgi:gamma-glutamylcyclotransferase (GGCT)/AIG2-like uncharacterized protein YtfP